MTDSYSPQIVARRSRTQPFRSLLRLLAGAAEWLRRPVRPPAPPDYLWDDLGLRPEDVPSHLASLHRNPADLTLFPVRKR